LITETKVGLWKKRTAME